MISSILDKITFKSSQGSAFEHGNVGPLYITDLDNTPVVPQIEVLQLLHVLVQPQGSFTTMSVQQGLVGKYAIF